MLRKNGELKMKNIKKLLIVITVLIILLFCLVSCASTQSISKTGNADIDAAEDFIHKYRGIAKEFDSKNAELYKEFENLETVSEGIKNLNKRIENMQKYRSDLLSLSVPEIVKKFYQLKIEEIDSGIDLLESSVNYYQNGYPEIKELEEMQKENYELAKKSNAEIMSVIKKYNLDY